MRVAFLIWSRGGGGAEKAMTLLANSLVENGHDVLFFQMYHKKEEYELDSRVINKANTDYPLPHFWFGKYKYHFYLNQAVEIRKFKPDIVVPVLAMMELRGLFATIFTPAKLIMTIRNNPRFSPNSRKRRITRNIISLFADGIYVQNQSQAEFFPGFMQKKIFVLPNIIDEKFSLIEPKDVHPIRYFVNSARLMEQKNQKMLIRAFKRLVEETDNKQLRLYIYGDGELKNEIKEYVDSINMSKYIRIPGRTNDLPKIYEEKADAFVLSSNFEGSPNALWEAMAAGLPCISTDCKDGPSDYLVNNENGLLIPVDDEEEMYLAMRKLVDDPEFAHEIAVKGKETIMKSKNATEIANRFIEECNKL